MTESRSKDESLQRSPEPAPDETPRPPADKELMLDFLRFYFRYSGWKAYESIGQQLVLSLLSGVGLLMLIPFLYIVGVGDGGKQSGIMAMVVSAVDSLGLDLNLGTGLIVFVLILSSHALLRYRQTVVSSEIVEEFSRHLRQRMYEAMARAQWLRIVGMKASAINHVISSDVGAILEAVRQQQTLIGTLLLFTINIAIAFYLSVYATLISLACGGVLLLALRPLSKDIARSGQKRHASWKGIYSAISDHLTGLKVAKSYGLENDYIQRFDRLGRDMVEAVVDYTRVSEKGRIFQGIGVAVALSTFIYFGVEIVQLPLAELILLILLFSRLLPQFSSLNTTWHRLVHAVPSLAEYRSMFAQLAEAMEQEGQDDVTALSVHKAVRLENLSFNYESVSEPALESISLEIPARKMTAIVGSSGAGKSTLADLLIGLLLPTSGRILIDDEPLTQGNIHAWRKAVGYVPQETFLFHDTIRANVLSGKPDASEEEILAALKAAAANQFIARLPEGVETVVGDRGIRLSGGERQRIALARALVRRPAMLLLDEATSALDTENEQRIKDAIDDLQGSLTVVVIAHRLSTVRNADHIVVLDRGRIAEAGTWDELVGLKGGAFRLMIEADMSLSEHAISE